MLTSTAPECLDHPEVRNFINVEIPKMLTRNDVAPYVTIAARQVSAGPAPQDPSRILVVYHLPHDLRDPFASRRVSRKSSKLLQRITDIATRYCQLAFVHAMDRHIAEHPISQNPKDVWAPVALSAFKTIPAGDPHGPEFQMLLQEIRDDDYQSLRIGEFRAGAYNHIRFAVTRMPTQPKTFVVQTSNTNTGSVISTDFVDDHRQLPQTLEQVCRSLHDLANKTE